MKRFGILCLLGVLVLALAGCSKVNGAEKALDASMQVLKDSEKTGAQLDLILEGILSENKEELKTELSALAAAVDYKIESAQEQENGTVTLRVKLKTVDSSYVMDSFIAKMMEMVSSPDYQAKLETMNKEDYHTALVSMMLAVLEEELPLMEQELVITMVKTADGWKMENENAVMQTLFSGLAEAVSSLV